LCIQDKAEQVYSVEESVDTETNSNRILTTVDAKVLLKDNNIVQNHPQDLSSSKNNHPAQPKLTMYPTTNGRHFSIKYYQLYEWLEYSISLDALYCFVCRHFAASITAPGEVFGKLSFVDYGATCNKWKDFKGTLNKHERNKRHIISMQRWIDYRLVQNNICIKPNNTCSTK